MKGTTTIENNLLQQEERDSISKVTIKNNSNKSLRNTPTTQNWKIWLNEEEFSTWEENRKRFFLFFDGASKYTPRKVGAGGIIIDPWGKTKIFYEWGLR